MRRAGPRFAFRRDPGGACPAGADYRDHGADPSKPARATRCVYLIGKEQQRRCARRLASMLPRVKHQDPAAKVRLLEIAASQWSLSARQHASVCPLPSSKSRMSLFPTRFPPTKSPDPVSCPRASSSSGLASTHQWQAKLAGLAHVSDIIVCYWRPFCPARINRPFP
jgi:hypothetical protein